MTIISLFLAGTKGLNLLRHLAGRTQIATVCSYPGRGTLCDSYAAIRSLCATHAIRFVNKADFDQGLMAESDLVFCAGWQFLTSEIDSRYIVFHDSLLPRYRGFAPTVAALNAGDRKLGVSAFRPEPGVDTGDVLGQEAFDVTYPITIRDAYERLGHAYAVLADRLLAAAEKGSLAGIPQVEIDATYSLWRDEKDYDIDWNGSAEEIRRFIDAVGWPYLGAKTRYMGEEIRIEEAEACPDLTFVNRQPGKIWAIQPTKTQADIVCGKGMLRILKAIRKDGTPLRFVSLRQRLGD